MRAPETETLSEAFIARFEPLYHQSQLMQIWALLQPLGPLSAWTGCLSRTWAGRLASVLGGQRLANILHWRNYRRYPGDVGACTYYGHSLLVRRGPLAAREFMTRLRVPQAADNPDMAQYYYTLRACIDAEFRDFETAEDFLQQAAEILPGTPWLRVMQSSLLEKQDRYEEALAVARSALADNPNYRPGVQSVAHLLQVLDRDDEALALLTAVVERTQAHPLALGLAVLQIDLGHNSEALATLDRVLEWAPLADSSLHKWAARSRLRLACRAGDVATARRLCQEVLAQTRRKDEYHEALAERLAQPDPPRRRVCLAVDFVRQHHKTCAPATLAALARYWGHRANHLEVAEAICYDGTPAHSERRWAATQGLVVREFTVTWEAAAALLDRGVPFTLTTTETTNSHLQAVVGYDELRQALLLRDPFDYYLAEALCPRFLEYYAPFGPRGMVMVPPAEAHRLEGVELPDALLYDRLHEVETALSGHRREEALAIHAAMKRDFPNHRLTHLASWSLSGYDANPAATLHVLEQLLGLHPKCGRYQLAKYDCLGILATRADRLEYLEQITSGEASEPIFDQRMAMELRVDSRHLERAAWLARQALKRRPVEADFLRSMADIRWDQRRLEEATDYYRLAVCSSQHQEYYCRSYFIALGHLRQTARGLAFLRRRFEMLGDQSAQPAMTLFECLAQCGLAQDGLAVLDEARRRRPEDGELLLFHAQALARYGQREKAEQALRQAEGRTRRTDWLRMAARLASLAGNSAQALAHWQDVLALEPLALDATQEVARLLAAIREAAAARAFLDDVCCRFPGHCGLLRLRAEFVKEEPLAVVEPALRAVLTANPADAWAVRELAIHLTNAGRLEEAMVEAERALVLEPNHSAGFTVRGDLHRAAGRMDQARADYERALRLDVNNAYAMQQYVDLCPTAAQRQAALDCIQAELVRQVVFEDALPAFYQTARGLLPPEAVLARLREALAARPDLWSIWSVTISQLTDMDLLNEALDMAREACQRFPFVPRLWLEAARLHQVRGQPAEALAALDHALAINPGFGLALCRKSELLEMTGQLEAACQTMESGVAQAPLDGQLHARWAELLWKAGQREAAVERLRQAVRVAPGLGWGWEMLQAWAVELKQPALAVEAARELVRQTPGEPRSWMTLADCLMPSGDEESLAAINRALELNPRCLDACDLKARILTRLDRCDEAIEACRQCGISPLPPVLQMRLAWVEAQRGRLAAAIAAMEAALAQAPAYYGAWRMLCSWHQELGQLDQAAAAADQMALLAPQDPVPLMYAADLFAQKGDRPAAMTRARRAVQLNPGYEYAARKLGTWLVEEAEESGNRTEATAFIEQMRDSRERDYFSALRVRRLLLEGDTDAALQEFDRLIRMADAQHAPALFEAAGRLAAHGLLKPVWRAVRAVLAELPAAGAGPYSAHPWLGALDVQWRFDHGRYSWPRYARRLAGDSSLFYQLMAQYFECAARAYDESCNNQRPFPWLLAWQLQRHVRHYHAYLKADDFLWGKVGYALGSLGAYRALQAWQADWPERQNVAPWMLWNQLLALVALRQWAPARTLVGHCLQMRQEPGIYWSFVQLAAALESLEGNFAEAGRLLEPAPGVQLDSNDKALRALAETALWLSQQPDRRGWRGWRDLRELLGRLNTGLQGMSFHRHNRLVGNCYRRAVRQWLRQRRWPALWGWLAWRQMQWKWFMVPLFPLVLPFYILTELAGIPTFRHTYVRWRR